MLADYTDITFMPMIPSVQVRYGTHGLIEIFLIVGHIQSQI